MNPEPKPNPLLDKLRIPGATYRLPSQGLFYGPGVLDEVVKNGEVEVYPMTAIDEIILSTPDKLLSGKAIMEVFARCIPNIKRPYDLLSKDVDFLMACLRLVSFGQFMSVSYKHDCEDALEHDYEIDLDAIIRKTKQIDPTTISTEYKTQLPNGQTVTMKPLTYGDVVDLYQTTALIKSEDITEAEATDLIVKTIASIICDVDGIVDKDLVCEWLIQLPLGWKNQIQRAAQDVSQWGADFTVEKVCQDCGETMKIQVTTNPVSFFI